MLKGLCIAREVSSCGQVRANFANQPPRVNDNVKSRERSVVRPISTGLRISERPARHELA